MKSSNAVFLTVIFVMLFSCSMQDDTRDAGPTFHIRYSDQLSSEGLDGRLLLLISNNNEREPRFQISDGPQTQLVYGINVDGLQPGQEATIDHGVFGYPLESISMVPPGDYFVQALLHKYETFQLGTGHTVKLPMDQGEGQQWNRSPGNLYSQPEKITIDASGAQEFHIEMDQEIPPITPPEDTEYIKHVRIQSALLTEFWGRPMYLQANVLIPHGFQKDADTRYPLMVFHGHFPYTFDGFRTQPPTADPNDSVYNARFGIYGYQYIQEKEAYELYQNWIRSDFPRYVVIEIQHQNPYYDDSYAVNSANLGPYGDAITHELIPHVESLFNCVGEGWGRFLYGGSTGGWEALAVQVFYPDEYNGCFAACPDPIDFRHYTVVNIYEDLNAYYLESAFKKTPRPGHRDYLGHVSSTLQDMNHRELALGDHGRSGQQWDIWQAVYSPAGDDGYPQPIWDKRTGEIDRKVAEYWKEHYDLRYILERDWATLGPRLEGKIHIYCGDMDNYYLNNAVMAMEEFLENTSQPYYNGVVDYGDRQEHCWNGDHENPNQISRLRYNTMYIPIIRERLRATAPADHGLENWGF
jgi:hypothetical protein